MPDIADRIANDFDLTQEEREELLPSGRQRLLYNRLTWAKFYLSKAGLVNTPRRGRFIASDAGRTLLAGNPTKVDVDLLKTFPVYAAFIGKTVEASPVGDLKGEPAAAASFATPEEQIDAAYGVRPQEPRKPPFPSGSALSRMAEIRAFRWATAAVCRFKNGRKSAGTGSGYQIAFR